MLHGKGTAGGGDGDYGYNTSFGPAIAYSNLWVNDWISMYSDPRGRGACPKAAAAGAHAGGMGRRATVRHGAVVE